VPATAWDNADHSNVRKNQSTTASMSSGCLPSMTVPWPASESTGAPTAPRPRPRASGRSARRRDLPNSPRSGRAAAAARHRLFDLQPAVVQRRRQEGERTNGGIVGRRHRGYVRAERCPRHCRYAWRRSRDGPPGTLERRPRRSSGPRRSPESPDRPSKPLSPAPKVDGQRGHAGLRQLLGGHIPVVAAAGSHVKQHDPGSRLFLREEQRPAHNDAIPAVNVTDWISTPWPAGGDTNIRPRADATDTRRGRHDTGPREGCRNRGEHNHREGSQAALHWSSATISRTARSRPRAKPGQRCCARCSTRRSPGSRLSAGR